LVLALLLLINVLSSKPQSEPDLNVEVTDFYPRGEIDLRTNFTIEFSRDMVPDDSLNLPVLDPPLEIEPAIAGLARWIDNDVLRFYPDEQLLPATSYEIRVKSDKEYLYGNRINEKESFKVNTPPLRILSVHSYTTTVPEYPGDVRISIVIEFNYEVHSDELRPRVSIEGRRDAEKQRLDFKLGSVDMDPEGEPVDAGADNYAKIVTEPVKLSERRQSYSLRIEEGLNCPNCGNVPSSEYVTTIDVEAKRRLFVRELSAWYSDLQPTIQIPFSTQIAVEKPEQYISINPEIDFTAEVRYNSITLYGNFKAGETYEVTVSEGLTSRDGSVLEKRFSSKVIIPDIPPTVRFLSRGIYLPREGSHLLELETINIDELAVEVEQYFANNLVYALASGSAAGYGYRSNTAVLGRTFYDTILNLESETNEALTTTVDLGAVIGDSLFGIFKISARNKERRWDSDSRLVMLTEMGIMARMSDDYLMVWVNSLQDVSPVKKAEITLWSRNNQLLVQGKTDSRGICIFENIAEKIAGFDPFLITVVADGDLSFLKFDDALLPISDFDVKGRPHITSGYEAYIYTDRGIYRPGDTVHLASIVRESEGRLPDEFPYIITINDPSGREFKSFRVKTGGSSFLEKDILLPDFSRTGIYSARAHIGEELEIGRAEFQVEEFMPDRIKVTVETERDSYSPGEFVNIDVDGQFLFGAPAAGHRVSAGIRIEAKDFSPEDFASYTFSDNDRAFSRITESLGDDILDDSGYQSYRYRIPENLSPPSALRALASASVSEQGGRAVNSYAKFTINPYPRYIGMRPEFEGYARPGEPAELSLVALKSDKTKISIDSLRVDFYRVIYHSILRKDRNGNYRYVSESSLNLIDSAYVTLDADGGSISFVPPEYGKYMVRAADQDGGHRTSYSFYASGWGYAPWSMDNPDRIEIDLDRESYNEKEKAKLQIRSPFGGKLLLTVEKTEVLDLITYEMDGNTAEITIPVKKDYFPNAYITATVIRPADQIEKTTPARAFGVVPIMLKTEERKLPLKINVPDEIQPRSRLSVDINVGSPGVTELTVSAVDAGIVQLTDARAPDPLEFFYGKRKLHLMPYDIYSFIYPEVEKAQSHLSPAGDRGLMEFADRRHLMPVQARRVKPVSLWSGIVRTDENGYASIKLDIPQFNGQLILDAAGVQGDRFGSTSANVTVRDKIILQEAFPRFVAPNDVVEGLVTVYNRTGEMADIKVELSYEGPVEMLSPAAQTIRVPHDSESRAVFRFKAGIKPGKIEFAITAGDGEASTKIEFELPNRPGQPIKTENGSGAVTEDNPAEFSLPDRWFENTERYVIQTSSLTAVAFTDNINFLVRYPYGCLEQTTSRLFPLLYYDELVRFVQPELMGSGGANYFIQEGIIKLTGMIRDDGSFNFWPEGEYYNSWASVYASHFLIEARRKGFYIDEDIYALIIGNLNDHVYGRKTEAISAPERIYAAYVLAQADRLDRKGINYLKSLQVSELPPYSRFQLAGALGAAGDRESAFGILPTDIQPRIFEPETGGNFSSGVRSNAILLDVLTQIDPENPSAAVLANSLMEAAEAGRWYTTQENAFALMALGKYFGGREKPDFTGAVQVDGQSYRITTEDFKKILTDLDGNNVSISISGEGSCYYYWQSSGVPLDYAPEEYTRGIKITRRYLDGDGAEIDLQDVSLGDQLICHIRAETENDLLENVVINDMLPAGLEIENPRLKTTPNLSWLPEKSSQVTYSDIRDDRMLLFTNLKSEKPFEYYYSLRAVSAGEFSIPPSAAECMYNPVISGAGSSGTLIVRGSSR